MKNQQNITTENTHTNNITLLYNSFQIPRLSVPQLGKLIAFELAFLQNNEILLTAILLFQIIIHSGIKNKNRWRPVGQSP